MTRMGLKLLHGKLRKRRSCQPTSRQHPLGVLNLLINTFLDGRQACYRRHLRDAVRDENPLCFFPDW